MARTLLMTFLISLSLNLSSQEKNRVPPLSLNYSNTSIREILEDLSEKYELDFAYSGKQVPVNTKINLQADNASLEEVLDLISNGLPMEFKILGDQIILKKSSKSISSTATISGYLKDDQNGEVLLGATVQVKNETIGTMANNYGFYSLTLEKGSYVLRYSFVGYEPIEQNIDLRVNTRLDLTLVPSSSMLQEIEVRPSDSATRAENILHSVVEMDSRVVLQKPAALGESDVVKALDIIPGVQLFRDGSTFYNVRGGDRDQNQILVDEAPIYNPAHFLGLFSSFRPDAIQSMHLYKGNLPSKFGGRISSVLDIKTREGNVNQFGMQGSLGMISGRLSLEGPISKGNSSYFISGRRSFIGALMEANSPEISSFYFSDFNAKTNIRINDNNRLYASVFSGTDEFLAEGGVSWQNNAGTLRWNRIWGDRLFSNTTFFASRYDYELVGGPNLFWNNHIANASLKTDFSFYRSPSQTLEFGFLFGGNNFNPGNIEDSTGVIPIGYPFVPKRNTVDFSLYTGYEWNPSPQWNIYTGIRISTWTNHGKTIEYELDETYQVVDETLYDTRDAYNSYANLEPRFRLTYLLESGQFLKFDYTKNAQYISLISNSISPFNNLEVWLPASINLKPQIGHQFTLGWFSAPNNFQLSVETYYKFLDQQVDYRNQSQLLLNPTLEAELRTGIGWAYGAEFTISKTSGDWVGWMSYSYGRSYRKIEEINQGQAYPTLWDKPHQFVINSSYQWTRRLILSGTFYLSSGSTLTSPTSYYEYQDRVVPIYSEVNNDRFPTYHRFDVSLNYRLNKVDRRFNHSLAFSLFNLYGQQNPILKSNNKIEVEEGIFRVPLDLSGNPELVSTKLFVYQLVPSLTYSFSL